MKRIKLLGFGVSRGVARTLFVGYVAVNTVLGVVWMKQFDETGDGMPGKAFLDAVAVARVDFYATSILCWVAFAATFGLVFGYVYAAYTVDKRVLCDCECSCSSERLGRAVSRVDRDYDTFRKIVTAESVSDSEF